MTDQTTEEVKHSEQKDPVFTVTIQMDRKHISNILCSAIDPGYGSSYAWITEMRKRKPPIWEFDSDLELSKGKHFLQDYPLNPGGALTFAALDDDKTYILDWKAIQKGLQRMAEKYPFHFCNMVDPESSQADAETGDVFLQCCLFEEGIVYG